MVAIVWAYDSAIMVQSLSIFFVLVKDKNATSVANWEFQKDNRSALSNAASEEKKFINDNMLSYFHAIPQNLLDFWTKLPIVNKSPYTLSGRDQLGFYS